MRSDLPVRRSRMRAAVAALAAVLVLSAPSSAHARSSSPPQLADGFGLTQTDAAYGSETNFVITVKTAQVAGEHRIRILLPDDYAANPTKRYPVLYFLHGTSDDPENPRLAYPALVAAKSMITVIPDGGS